MKINFVTLPREDSQEANDAIHAMLLEYNNPANSQNAGRAGWRAARLHLEAALTEQVQPAQGEPPIDFELAYGGIYKEQRRQLNAALLQSNAAQVTVNMADANIDFLFDKLESSDKTKLFSSKNWFTAGVTTGEAFQAEITKGQQ